ncbi:hypothetical protein C8J56DRAFT_872350 [Mycena floridula]|nr:hypothetical protein C8J56DRAFT_872350 [Mycena floridula]
MEQQHVDLIRRSFSARVCQSTARVVRHLPSPRLPNEILARIITLALSTSESDFPSSKGLYYSIYSFSVASRGFRQIALRQYFTIVRVSEPHQWQAVVHMLKQTNLGSKKGDLYCFSNVQMLSATSRSVQSNTMIALQYFTHIQELSIDCRTEGLSSQQQALRNIFQNLVTRRDPSLQMTTLTLVSLPRIDVPLLRLIASTFPHLINLVLSSTERLDFGHCAACYEESLSVIIHSPIPDTYLEVSDLCNAFATALKPLSKLKDLHLGVFLSEEDLANDHIAHILSDYENSDDEISVFGPDGCRVCRVESEQVRNRELEASLLLAKRLRSLDSIGWSTFFNQAENNVDWKGEDIGGIQEDPTSATENLAVGGVDLRKHRRTKIWIKRDEACIKVRRAPW